MEVNKLADYLRKYETNFGKVKDIEPIQLSEDDLRFLSSATCHSGEFQEYRPEENNQAMENRNFSNAKAWLKRYWKSPQTEDPFKIASEIRDCFSSLDASKSDIPKEEAGTLVEALRRVSIQQKAVGFEQALRTGKDELIKTQFRELYNNSEELDSWLLDKMAIYQKQQKKQQASRVR